MLDGERDNRTQYMRGRDENAYLDERSDERKYIEMLVMLLEKSVRKM